MGTILSGPTLPLGFNGGVEDEDFGISVIQGRPFDTRLGQWMTPKPIIDRLETEEDLRQYRLRWKLSHWINELLQVQLPRPGKTFDY